MRFPIHVPLTGHGLDRAAPLRDDDAAVAALRAAPEARALGLWGDKAPILLGDAPRLDWRPVADLAEFSDEPMVFLGRDPSGAGRFGMFFSGQDDPLTLGAFGATAKFIDLRSISMELPPGEPTVWAEAKSLLMWHATHPHCSKCGAPTAHAQGGWRRDCPSCGAKHFPRTDPVVIMLIVRRDADGSEHVILGRQRHFPPGMHSLLAGYVEPGETIEDAVRRETQEEAGVACGAVGYLASQPWPFPSTLMIGCWTEALSSELKPDDDELESVRWASKEEMRLALAGEHPEFKAPRQDAIARVLIEAWATDQITLEFGG